LRTTSEWKITFRIFGAMAILVAVVILGTITAARATILRSRGVDVGPLSVVAAAWLGVAGLGMLRPTRWGAAMLAVALAAPILSWAGDAVREGAYLSAGLAVFVSPLFLAPAYVTLRRWSSLPTWW
jgi:hypothetical protein